MSVESIAVVGPFQCNCRLLVCPRTRDAVLIDPGDEASRILQLLDDYEKTHGARPRVRALFHTHAHLDHIGATRDVKLALGGGDSVTEIYLHRDDEELYRNLRMQGSLFGLRYDDPLPVDRYFEDEQDLRIGSLRFSVIHTPGHSPGSVSLRLHEASDLAVPETVFTGDTLFQGSVGRTDLWGADGDAMFRNIRERLLVLDGDTRVCPGHGPDSTIGVEKRSNPFLV